MSQKEVAKHRDWGIEGDDVGRCPVGIGKSAGDYREESEML
jgi:hypothetical protein